MDHCEPRLVPRNAVPCRPDLAPLPSSTILGPGLGLGLGLLLLPVLELLWPARAGSLLAHRSSYKRSKLFTTSCTNQAGIKHSCRPLSMPLTSKGISG